MLTGICGILFHQHWNANIHNTLKCYGTKKLYVKTTAQDTINNGTIPLKSCTPFN